MKNITSLVMVAQKKISEQFKIPFLGEIPLNYGIMSGSDLGKPIMTTHADSPSADAFRTSAKKCCSPM